MSTSFFSETYAQARSRFRDAASEAGAQQFSYGIDVKGQGDLSMDVAIIGNESDPTLVLSSAVHGVEGFFGSAIQLSLLESLIDKERSAPIRYVLLHGINPFGFANLRRFDEGNVDLNRNFPANSEDLPEASELYRRLNSLLNPESPPRRYDAFMLKLIWCILRFGKQRIRAAIAGGQYAFPKGLFFGGTTPSQAACIVQSNCDSWIGGSDVVLHIDLHSGLGAFANYKMLITERVGSKEHRWHGNAFGDDRVEALAAADIEKDSGKVAYPVFGLFGKWMQDHFSKKIYHFAAAEFGTHADTRVLRALRAENRAHHHSSDADPTFTQAKRELLECFCPRSPTWRERVVRSGLEIINQGANALHRS